MTLRPVTIRPILVGIAAVLAAALLSALAPARADAFGCTASAVRGTVLGSGTIEPVVANPGGGDCKTDVRGLSVPLSTVLTANVVSARTAAQGTGVAETADAAGGLSDIRLLSLPDLPITLPTADLSSLKPIDIAGVGSIDVAAAVRALLPDNRLPRANLVEVAALTASARGACVSGQPQLTGTSSVLGLKVLGAELGVDEIVERTTNLIDTASVDPSDIDLSSVPLVGGGTVDLRPLQATVQPLLDALPTISIPATVAQIRVSPAQQERVGDRLTQRALRVEASIAGTPIADVVLGEATVTSTGAQCAAAPSSAAGVAESALRCTKRRLVLIDVLPGRRVRLVGAADRRFSGRRVSIFFTHTGRRVATAVVGRDGMFRTTAKMPPRSIRGTNRARYQARIGRERSLRLKLQRRMIVRSVRVRNGRVRISGTVRRPLAKPIRTIEIRRRVSCRRSVVVKRFKPNRRGNFSVVVKAPPSQLAAVYRAATRVRKTRRNPKTYPTFTLPRFVDLARETPRT
jgi:hypothetical protein